LMEMIIMGLSWSLLLSSFFCPHDTCMVVSAHLNMLAAVA